MTFLSMIDIEIERSNLMLIVYSKSEVMNTFRHCRKTGLPGFYVVKFSLERAKKLSKALKDI